MRSWMGCVLVATCLTGQVRAQSPIADPDAAPPTDTSESGDAAAEEVPSSYRLNFEAGRVRFQDDLRELDLQDDVVVQVDRYRLTSDALHVERTPSGIVVSGTGRLAFCPCPDPPVAIGFDSVLVAPPTDLLVENPTLRVGGVPVLWAPYLWLRSPNQIGMLPPEVAWRGEDGLRLGTGLHIPLRGGGSTEPQAVFDVRAAGYVEGGARVSTAATTSRTTTHVIWDHLDRDMLALEAQGSLLPVSPASIAWRADLLRGERGLEATSDVHEVALLRDQAALAVFSRSGGAAFGVEAQANAFRGESIDSLGAGGPIASLSWGTGAFDAGTVEVGLSSATLESGQGTLSVVEQSGALQLDARPGPLSIQARIDERAGTWSESLGARAWAQAQASGSVGLPLIRRYSKQLVHWIEPFARAGARVRREAPPWFADQQNADDLDLAAGVSSSLGNRAARRGGRLVAELAWAGPTREPHPEARGRAVIDDAWFALGGEAAWRIENEDGRASARLRLGRQAGLHLRSYISGSSGDEPIPVHASWSLTHVSWFESPGYSTGGDLVIPWARWLATLAGADFDLESRRWIATRGAFVYRHDCACLAAHLWAGQRVGRAGFDAGLSVDLLPM